MRKLSIAILSVAFVALGSTASADSQIVYPTKTACKAALAEARLDNPLYWIVECRQNSSGGWIFGTIDKGDQPTVDPSQP